ncbi:MAG: hypothetical protein IT427_10685 [Pirellulales bacterium]|nr:hypothetical protein [Pirellulales bacterium]
MLRAILSSLVATQIVGGTAAFAQLGGYSPYAAQQQPPVSADGKINWSTFYKSAQLEAKYEWLWQMGACGNTNKRITIPVAQNKLDVNKLLEGAVEGEVVKLGDGVLTMIDKDRRPLGVVLHPAGVTHVEITGPMPATRLKKGMNVRFETSVDQHGHSEQPLIKLDVITLTKNSRPSTIRPNSKQIIVGQVIDLRDGQLRVRVRSGALTRLIVPLEENAVANLDASDIRLAASGDQIEVKGHLWDGVGSNMGPTVFADEIILKRPLSPSHASLTFAN